MSRYHFPSYFQSHSTSPKFGVGKELYVFERSLLCSPRLHLFDHKYKDSNIVKNYLNEPFSI